MAMSKVERRVRLDEPNRHPHDLAYRARFHHEVMLQTSRPPNPRAVVEDEETQSATGILLRSRLSALEHACNTAIWMTGGMVRLNN